MICIRYKKTKRYVDELFQLAASINDIVLLFAVLICIVIFNLIDNVLNFNNPSANSFYMFMMVFLGIVFVIFVAYRAYGVDSKILKRLYFKNNKLIHKLTNEYNNIKQNHQEQIVIKKILNEEVEVELILFDKTATIIKLPVFNFFVGGIFTVEERMSFICKNIPSSKIKFVSHRRLPNNNFYKLKFKFIY